MLFKRTLSMLLAAAMSVMLLSGCGGDTPPDSESYPDDAALEPTYCKTLDVSEADLSWAPDVILEEGELTNWLDGNEVSWNLNLPFGGEYEFQITYSMPASYEGAEAWLDITTSADDGECGAGFTLYPSGESEDWDEYTTAYVSVELPAGHAHLAFYPSTLPDGQDEFIHLLQIDVVSYDPVGSGGSAEGVNMSDGWWVRPEGYEADGLSMVDYFSLDEESMTFTVYNMYGGASASMPYTLEDDVLTLDLDATSADFILSGDQLLDPETGEVEYVFVIDTPFVGDMADYTGNWYAQGDLNATFYQIGEQTAAKVSGAGSIEAPYQVMCTNVYHGAYHAGDLLALDVEGDLRNTLYPNDDSTILFEEDGFDYELYVREEACVPEMQPTYAMVSNIMKEGAETEVMDGEKYYLELTPYCFSLIPYEADGDSLSPKEDGTVFGQWSIPEPGVLELAFENGTTDTVPMNTDRRDFYVPSLDMEFQTNLDPFA